VCVLALPLDDQHDIVKSWTVIDRIIEVGPDLRHDTGLSGRDSEQSLRREGKGDVDGPR
jgi:hypothetical protein